MCSRGKIEVSEPCIAKRKACEVAEKAQAQKLQVHLAQKLGKLHLPWMPQNGGAVFGMPINQSTLLCGPNLKNW